MAQAAMLEMVKVMIVVIIKRISRKKKKIITMVMVSPIEAMNNICLLMKTSATAIKHNIQSMGHCRRRQNPVNRLTHTLKKQIEDLEER